MLRKINYSCVLCARTYVELTGFSLVACPRCAVGGQHPRVSRMLQLIDEALIDQVRHERQSREPSLS
jgi:hypothetical protein